MKKLRTILLICILLIFVGSTSLSSEAASAWKKIDGQWYYVLDNGTHYKNGWLKYNNNYYYCDTSDGHMLVGWQQVPIATGSTTKNWFYFDTNEGYMLTGWQVLPVNNVATTKATYYLDEGQMTIGWKQISNKWYYFDTNGRMLKGWQELASSGTSSKNWYYLDTTDGHVLTNWQYLPISNDSTTKDWYYFASSGIMQKGWKNLDGKIYYLKSNGRMTTGLADCICDADGKKYTYYFNNDGIRQSGWFYLKDEWKYFNADGQLFHIVINATNFPDTAIRKFVKTLDKNTNNYLDYDELPYWIDYAKNGSWWSNNTNFSNISESIANVSGLEYLLPKINTFNFIEADNANSKITNLDLSKASNLKNLTIINLNNLTSVTTNSSNLAQIDFDYNKKLTTITNSSTKNNSSLTVHIAECDSLKSFNNIYNPTTLYISNCASLSNLNITKCTNLTEISLYNLPKLTSVDFSKNTKLKEVTTDIDISVNNYNITDYYINCSYNITIPDYTKYTKLQTLYINGTFDDIPIIKLPKTSGELKVYAYNSNSKSFLIDNRDNKSANIDYTSEDEIISKEGFYKVTTLNSSYNFPKYTNCYIKFDNNDYPYVVKGELDTDLGHFLFDDNGFLYSGKLIKNNDIYLYSDDGVLPNEATSNDTKIMGKAITGLINSDTFTGCSYYYYYDPSYSGEHRYYKTTLYSYCDETGKVLTGKQIINGKEYDFEKIKLYAFHASDPDDFIYAVAPYCFIHKIDSNTYSIDTCDMDNSTEIRYYDGTSYYKEGILTDSKAYTDFGGYKLYTNSYAFLVKDYKLVIEEGIHEYNNSLYYVNTNSVNFFNLPVLNSGLFKGKDTYYYTDKNSSQPYKIVQNKLFSITTKYSDTNISTYYYIADQDGKINGGFQQYNNKLYYAKPLSENAPYLVMNQKFKLNDKEYYATEDGSLYIGWLIDKNNLYYYYKEDGSLAINEIIVQNNKKMYLLKDGHLLRDSTTMCYAEGEYNNKLICTDENGYFVDGISKDHLYCIDGMVQQNIEINGEISDNYVLTLNGKKYIVLNSSGRLAESGSYSYKIKEEPDNFTDYDTYYVDNYNIVIGLYLDTKHNRTYYFNEDGLMQKNKFITIDGKTKYFDDLGYMKTGRFYPYKDMSKCYFADKDGNLQKGLITDNTTSKTYYRIANDDFILIEGPEFVDYSGNTYYIRSQAIQTGLFSVTENNSIVERYGPESAKGALQSGWQTINDKKYYFGTKSENNFAAKYGFTKIDNKYYYFARHMLTGWLDIKYNNETIKMYFDPDLKTGLFKVDNYTYYADPTTFKLAKYTSIKIKNKIYLFDNDCHQITTPGFSIIDSKKYYLDSNGCAITGFAKIEDRFYYFNEDGSMCTSSVTIDGQLIECFGYNGYIKNGIFILDGVKYEIVNGKIKNTNGWVEEDNHKVYYKDNQKVTGLQIIDNKTYYFNSNGYMQTGWITLSNNNYYFNTNGAMVTGWKQISKKWYYFNAKGIMLKNWQQINKKWYYFGSNGIMVTGWKRLSKKWYYFNSNGVMKTGWLHLSNKWYYFNTSGEMITGWKQISKKWYYFASSGTMTVGWKQIGGKWYYFASTGIMKTCWLKSSGKWYYLDIDGHMLSNTNKKISGKVYKFNKNGVCLNP